jgi:arginine/ornithine transport system substrate-binding protein
MTARIWTRLLLMVLVLAAGRASAQDWSQLRVAIEGSYPPFSERDSKDGWKGFDIDIAKALCEHMQAKCVFVQRDWDQIQEALLKKQADAIIASMSITVPRKQRFDFTNRYYHTAAHFVGPQDSKIEFTRDGLTGKRLGVQAKTVHENFVRDNYGSIAQIITYPTQQDALKALKAGDIDLLLGDAMALHAGFLSTPDGKGYAFLGPDFNDARWFGEGIGIAVRKEDQDLRYKLNRAIDDIRANGTYVKLSDKYFGYDIYGAS